MSRCEVAHLDDLDSFPVEHGLEWHPIRRRFGIQSFGVNAYTSAKPGDWVVEEHKEGSGHEELYLVVSGRARFTLDGEELDAPAGTIVFLPDASVVRVARAEEDGTIAGFAGNRGSFITWLFVHPSFRRRGVGTALVRDLLRKLDQPVTLNVALTNGPAMSLYQRMGFKVEREFLGDFNGHPCKVARLRYAAAA